MTQLYLHPTPPYVFVTWYSIKLSDDFTYNQLVNSCWPGWLQAVPQ
jgi:hypothetical protein